ncbi:hypothetical protein L2E82_47330 [Cichorium intybus]|uniref:Uncharacterized protein n=1 Tax=Cichorium intybus TaxID=13427 RepID=A0ACB8YV73_CICIN|nr:hypothetical protein L2E82_47330 [Cichorium intybus]
MVWPTTKSTELVKKGNGFGDKRFVIRVSEVEGNLFKPVRLVKVGNSNHRHESNVVGDSEEEKRVESDELSSDEDQIISSDDGTQLDFSDEEEDKFDLDDDEYSFVPDTVFEEGIKDSSACDEDEREQNDKGDDLVDANDSPITPKKSEGDDTDPQFRSYACDSNTVPDTVVEERITYSVARDEEEREQNVKGDEVGLTDENDEELQIGADENTEIQYKIFEETIKPLSACEGEIMLNLGPVYEIKEASVKGGPHKPKKPDVKERAPETNLSECDSNSSPYDLENCLFGVGVGVFWWRCESELGGVAL